MRRRYVVYMDWDTVLRRRQSAAIRYSRLTAAELRARMAHYGVEISRAHAYRLISGENPDPSTTITAAFILATGVDPRWYFSPDPHALDQDSLNRYMESLDTTPSAEDASARQRPDDHGQPNRTNE